MTLPGQPVAAPPPPCYRHPDRPTRLSCGRCGKPLCPDCIRHGPVGIRCDECLRAPRAEVKAAHPERVPIALGVTIAQGVLWCVLLAGAGWATRSPSPNLFLSAIAGGLLGVVGWWIAGRVVPRALMRWILSMAAGAPLLAALILLAIFPSLIGEWVMYLRAGLAAGLGALVAWVAATRDW
jgi:hypothetical protein